MVDNVINIMCEWNDLMRRLLGSVVLALTSLNTRASDARVPLQTRHPPPVAGHDTSSSALTSMLDLVTRHPAALSRLAAEQSAVLAAHGPALTPAAAAAMPYAMAVIREALRMRPIVSGVLRKATRDIVLPGGPVIPSGARGVTFWAGAVTVVCCTCLFLCLAVGQEPNPRRDPHHRRTASSVPQNPNRPPGCPVMVAFSAMAEREPAWQSDLDQFRPERFLVGGGAEGGEVALAPLTPTFSPFGMGQR